ncbi:MAG: BamA/TamA family outer membrane protein [Acidobacteriaceae bacterium]|nr:BamA/TamA family outer membrane protein [Acidobacteriaceae bacterium]
MRNAARGYQLAGLLGLMFTAAPHHLAAQNFDGKIVMAIEYQPSPVPLDHRDLQRLQMVELNRPLNAAEVAATIDRLWSSGLFDNIIVDAQPRGAGVALRFITTQRRFIGHVGARGDINAPPSRGAIINDSQLYLGQPFDPEAVEEARQNLVQELRNNGLFESNVGVATTRDPVTNDMTIRFIVASGKRARYETPVFNGDTKLPDSTIIRATGWRWPLIKKWRQVTQSLTDRGQDGIQRAYAKRDRLTASVDMTSLDYDPQSNRAKASFEIEAGPKITIRAVEAKVSKRKLREFVPVYTQEAVDNDLLTMGARNLHDYFQSKGYPDVQVTVRREAVKEDQEVINYYIATGPRRKLVDISFQGDTYFMLETLRERMFLQTSSLLMRYGRYSEAFRKADETSIANLYMDNGFRDVKVTSSVQTDYQGKPADIAVTFHIDQGKQWRVGLLTIEGDNRLDLSPIRGQLASVEGQPYAALNIATDRNRILGYYYSKGFLSAAFSYAVTNGSEPETVNLNYRIREGPQEFVRSAVISGLYRTKPSIVKRYITVKDGEPLSLDQINNDARMLTSLGMFANVNTAIQNPDGATRYKYVLYDFDEAVRYTFKVGLGLIVGQFGQTTNNLTQAGGAQGLSPIISFDANRLNLFGTGQIASLQTYYSTLEQRASLNYTFPRFLGSLNRNLTFSALYDLTQNVQTFTSRREEASVQTSQRFNRASTVLLRFAYRRVSTSNIEIPALLIPQYLQAVRIGMLSASYIQDHRDNPTDAHRGFWNTLDTGLAGNYFGSQRNFVRILGRNATYIPIGRNLVFARQTQLGAIVPFKVPQGTFNFEYVPLPERFYGGGSVSMRGFGDNQAGPRDIGTTTELPGTPTSTPTGFPIGGNALFFNTFELRFPLLGQNITGVLFEDMGNIYTTFNQLSFAYHQPSEQNFNYAVQAPGFGIRYKTPIGPIRLDLAYALNPPHFLGFNVNEPISELIKCTPEQINVIPPCTPSPQQLRHFQFFFSIGQAF